MHNIICLEAEWQYNSQDKSNRFSLNTEPMLRWLKEFHHCDVIYRHILTREDLIYYLEYINKNKKQFKDYKIMYIACHGWFHSIELEGENGSIDLRELANIAPGVFRDRIVHFGCCKTLANEAESMIFKEQTGAKLICGYAVSVDPMRSSIADIALFNDLMTYTNVGGIKNPDRSKFRKTYKSLLDELNFVAL